MATFLKSPKDAIIRIPRAICADTRYARTRASRGIRKMASPSKHVLLLTEDRRQIAANVLSVT